MGEGGGTAAASVGGSHRSDGVGAESGACRADDDDEQDEGTADKGRDCRSALNRWKFCNIAGTWLFAVYSYTNLSRSDPLIIGRGRWPTFLARNLFPRA